MEVRLARRSEAPVPHPAVRVNAPRGSNNLRNGEIHVVGVADASRDAAEPGKCTVNLNMLDYLGTTHNNMNRKCNARASEIYSKVQLNCNKTLTCAKWVE